MGTEPVMGRRKQRTRGQRKRRIEATARAGDSGTPQAWPMPSFSRRTTKTLPVDCSLEGAIAALPDQVSGVEHSETLFVTINEYHPPHRNQLGQASDYSILLFTRAHNELVPVELQAPTRLRSTSREQQSSFAWRRGSFNPHTAG